MSGQSSPLPASSGLFISGQPMVMGIMAQQVNDYPNMLDAVFEAAMQEEQDRVQRQYIDRGIPAEVTVSYDAESMEVVYSALGEGVAEAEYGGLDSRPQAILRKAAVAGGKTFSRVLEKQAK